MLTWGGGRERNRLLTGFKVWLTVVTIQLLPVRLVDFQEDIVLLHIRHIEMDLSQNASGLQSLIVLNLYSGLICFNSSLFGYECINP